MAGFTAFPDPRRKVPAGPSAPPAPRTFEPPRPPATTVIGGKTYVGQPQLPQYDLWGQPMNRQNNGDTIQGPDNSVWTAVPGGTGMDGGQAPRSGEWRTGRDPRIEQLIQGLMTNSGGDYPGDVPGPDFSGLQDQQTQLQARLSELLAGRGINVGDVSTNPEAVANRVAVERAADQQRQAEAERLGASGMTSSGESDARNAQIREQTGTEIGGFNANLAGRLRGEAQQGAIQGAGLSLNNLTQQMAAQQALYGSRVEDRNAKLRASELQRQQKYQLLQQLLSMQRN